MILYLALALLSPPVPQEVSVTYSTMAKPANIIVAEIASKTGLELEASTGSQESILFIEAKNVPVETLLAKIAASASARWQVEGTKRVLVPDSSLRAEETRTETANRLKFLLANLDVLLREISKPSNESRQGQQLAENISWMHLNVVKACDLSAVAGLPINGRIVFSTNPTRSQRSINRNIEQFVKPHLEIHNKRMSKSEVQAPAEEGIPAELLELMKIFGGNRGSVVKQISKVLVIFERRNNEEMIHSTVRVLDEKGTFGISSEQGHFLGFADPRSDNETAPYNPLSAEAEAAEHSKKAPTQSNSPNIEYSALTKQFFEASAVQDAEGRKKFPAELLSALRNPLQQDPLGLAPSDELLAIAKAKNLSVVANISDQTLKSGSENTDKTVEAALDELERGDDYATVQDSNGWLVLKPRLPATARQTRTDRYALATLFSSGASNASARVSDLVAFVNSSRNPGESNFLTLLLPQLAPGATLRDRRGTSLWNSYQLFGSISSTQREQMERGAVFEYGQLTPTQKQILSNIVFGSASDLSENAGKKNIFEEFMPSVSSNFLNEPTEVCANGIPFDAQFTMNTSEEPFALSNGGLGTPGENGVLGADELMLFEMIIDKAPSEDINRLEPQAQELLFGERSVFQMNFQLAPNSGWSSKVYDSRLTPGAKPTSFRNMPTSAREKIVALRKAFEASKFGKIFDMMGGIGGMGGGNLPPPAP